jgi:peptidoglycan/xylan/chitin deacetylase (PgdA/CDA1 family)
MRSARRAERRIVRWLLAALALLTLSACAAQGPAAPAAPGLPVPEGIRLKTWPQEGEIRLDWDAIPGAVSYTLYWTASPAADARREHAITGLKGTRYTHTRLTNGTQYHYFLVGIDRAGKELGAAPPIVDVPYRYEMRRYPDLLAVVPRLHDTYESLAAQYLQDASKGSLIREFNNQPVPTPFRAMLIPLKPYEPGGLTDKGYRTVPILAYHQITLARPGKMAVLQPDFEKQMAYLKQNGYQVIPLQQFVDFLQFKAQVPERAVVITFDDGWASTYHVALPILKKYGYPATLFVTMDMIGSDKKALTWQQVKTLEESGVIDVQCHTRTHPNLADAENRDLKAYLDFLSDEIVASRLTLQKHIGKLCRYLAYPYGATNHLVVAIAQKAGYEAAFTVERGANPFFVTNYRVLRSMVYGEFDLQQFAENLQSFSDRVLK